MKKSLGQFYTKNAEYILQDLVVIPKTTQRIIDPFCGEWDLLNQIHTNIQKIGIDVYPKTPNTILNDSLLSPISYTNTDYIITNPPYIARNKNPNKTIYDKYNVSDLYLAALKSIQGCGGGTIILPVSFLTSSAITKERKNFLTHYQIEKIYIFEEQVFADTDYTVCSFSFVKGNGENTPIPVIIKPKNKQLTITLNQQNNYMFGGDIFTKPKTSIKISRLLQNQTPTSNIKLFCIDSGTENGKIHLAIDEPYFGKNTDRAFATIQFSKPISPQDQQLIVQKFNEKLNHLREKYDSLFLTNYRNSTASGARKRIGFTEAYILIGQVIDELNIT